MKKNLGISAAFLIILVLTLDNFISNAMLSSSIKITITIAFITYAIITKKQQKKMTSKHN